MSRRSAISKQWNLAIVGAAGAVGTEILRVLEERDFPVRELRLFASERSEGEFADFRGESILLERIGSESFAGIDIALFCADEAVSREYCPQAVAAGAVCIDLAGAWREDPEVPLVVPEVNPGAIAQYSSRGIIAHPACTTIELAAALKPLHDASRIRRLVVTTCQPVSAAGQKGVDELREQAGELLNGRPCESKVYPHQIAFNCLPQVGSFLDHGDTDEEVRVVHEIRRIFQDEGIAVTITSVLVPVFYGQGAAVNIETEGKISVSRARELLRAAPGLEVRDEPSESLYPLAAEAAGQDEIFVGRLREDLSVENGLNLWVVTDNLRKGAAVNAVQIAEILVDRHL